MRRIALYGLAGWSGIVALAWWLADSRIEICRHSSGYTCELRATAARDEGLFWGLAVALVAILLFAVAARYAHFRSSGEVFPRPARALEPHDRETFAARARGVARAMARAPAQAVARRVGGKVIWVTSRRALFAATAAMILFYLWVSPVESWRQPSHSAEDAVMADAELNAEAVESWRSRAAPTEADPYAAIDPPAPSGPNPFDTFDAQPAPAASAGAHRSGAADPYAGLATPVAPDTSVTGKTPPRE